MSVVARILAKKSKDAVDRIRGVFTGEAAAEQSRSYPLGLYLNATVRFDPTTFILAGNEIKVLHPEGDMPVVAIGEYRSLGVDFHRFYLRGLNDEESVLLVAGEGHNVEVVLYQTLDEVYPDDWGVWLNDQAGLIGFRDFSTPDGISYARALRNPGPDYVHPVEFRESIRGGGEAFSVRHAMMLYSRDIPNAAGDHLTEYLLVSKEEDEEGVLVRIMAGVPVDPMSLTIL
ncbi:MAG: YjfK family protein [Desulfobacteraceae bacterium]|nr:YjfK family protein [Desulfobacteraceae bacterium]